MIDKSRWHILSERATVANLSVNTDHDQDVWKIIDADRSSILVLQVLKMDFYDLSIEKDIEHSF